MYIHIADLHPGRCRNQRVFWEGGHPETLRCLDYEGTEHVCTFPEPVRRATTLTYTSGDTKPEPWVKPA